MEQGCTYLYGLRIFLFVTARAREYMERACKHQKIRQKTTFHVAAIKRSFKLSKKQFFHTLRKHRKTFAGAKVQQKNDMCKEMPYFFEQKDETRA